MEKRIIERYRITYENHTFQEKNLISHEDYLQIIKPKNDAIYNLEISNKKGINNSKIAKLKSELKDQFGSEWFTDQSPLYEAIKCHTLECGLCNKKYYASLERTKVLNVCESMLNSVHFLNVKSTSVIAIAKIVNLKVKDIDLHSIIFDGKLRSIRLQKQQQANNFMMDQANQLPF